MSEIHSFGIEPISSHAWNNDRSKLCLSPNTHEVQIFKRSGSTWSCTDILTEHVQQVTGIDWAPKSNRIVTCGVDRNAYVWENKDGKWHPTLVILRINRAATCVKWSPEENKFAVGSSARVISVCYFESENNWWVSKHIKKPIRSTVTTIDWHHGNILLASGSSDFKMRVFSGYVKEVEAKPEATVWGKKMTFGNLMAEFSNGGGGWVHSVSFSADGQKVAWVGHDSSISVVDAGNEMTVATLKTDQLPFLGCVWVTSNSIVTVGYGNCPMLFSLGSDGQLSFVHKLDVPKEKEEGKQSALNMFRSIDKRAQTTTNETKLDTLHQNAVSQVSIYNGDKNNAAKLSTSGTDGQLIIWDLKSLERSIAALKIA